MQTLLYANDKKSYPSGPSILCAAVRVNHVNYFYLYYSALRQLPIQVHELSQRIKYTCPCESHGAFVSSRQTFGRVHCKVQHCRIDCGAIYFMNRSKSKTTAPENELPN